MNMEKKYIDNLNRRKKANMRLINKTVITFRSKRYNVYETEICNNISTAYLCYTNRSLVIKGNQRFMVTKFSQDIRLFGNDGKNLFAPTIQDFKDFEHEEAY